MYYLCMYLDPHNLRRLLAEETERVISSSHWDLRAKPIRRIDSSAQSFAEMQSGSTVYTNGLCMNECDVRESLSKVGALRDVIG
jgi:hypothetical protein